MVGFCSCAGSNVSKHWIELNRANFECETAVGKLQCTTGVTGSSVRDKMSVIQTRIAHTCIFDTSKKRQ